MTLYLFIAFILFILLFGIFLFLISNIKRKQLIPDGEIMYKDTTERPGEILYAKTLPLIGKPDYIIKEKNILIPVELKTGKTPSAPYKSHIAQLFVYCFLIEECYGVIPPYGIIRYPKESFKVEYNQSFKKDIKQIVNKLLLIKYGKDENHRIIDGLKICFDCQKNHKSLIRFS